MRVDHHVSKSIVKQQVVALPPPGSTTMTLNSITPDHTKALANRFAGSLAEVNAQVRAAYGNDHFRSVQAINKIAQEHSIPDFIEIYALIAETGEPWETDK